MVNIRQEGWKEIKIGTGFEVEQRLECAPLTQELMPQPHGVNIAYTAVLGITLPLDRAGLSDQARYFHTHQRRMQYQQFREEGYPIGSGTVESGIKQVKARLTGPGMRWTRPNAQRMLVIRTAVLSGDFDRLWALAA